jgi:hypothetical protein
VTDEIKDIPTIDAVIRAKETGAIKETIRDGELTI